MDGNNQDGVAEAKNISPNAIIDLTSDGSSQSINFPSDLFSDEKRHYTAIEIVKSQRDRAAVNQTRSAKVFIQLPIPLSMSNGIGAGWNTLTFDSLLNPIANIGGSAAGMNNVGDVLRAVGSSAYSAVADFDYGGAASGALDAYRQSGAFGLVGAGVKSAINSQALAFGALKGLAAFEPGQIAEAGARIGVKNFNAQQFAGMGLREFTLSWKLTARSPTDTETLRQIEQFLKMGAHPEVIEGDFLIDYPNRFVLRYMYRDLNSDRSLTNIPEEENGFYKENPYLPRYKDLVLLSVNFDYSPSGVVTFTRRGAPLEIAITMSFRETELNYRKEFETGKVR